MIKVRGKMGPKRPKTQKKKGPSQVDENPPCQCRQGQAQNCHGKEYH